MEQLPGCPVPWAYKAPSLRRLIDQLQIDHQTATKLRKLVHATLHPSDIPGEQDYHERYRWRERVMCAIDRLLEGHGTEAVFHDDFSVANPVFEYVNMGDTYNATIVYDYTTDNFWLTCWGDMVELMERKGYKSE